jgi:beta-glucosidase/6-phospho-beta-glucosidase/beta-galactosidase
MQQTSSRANMVLANAQLTARFGVTFVDYEHGQERHAKKSAKVIGQVFNALIRKD